MVRVFLKRGIILCLLLSLLASCGYRFGHGEIPCRYRTISVCFADGDREGHFTSELVKALSTSGAFCYQREGADLVLEIELVEVEDIPVGYRFDRDGNEQVTDRVITTEGRLKGIAEVRGIDCCTGCTAVGPVRIAASVDYDHDYYSTGTRVPVFSLGQLDDLDVARDVAQLALDTELAEQIVAYLTTAW